MNTCFQHFIIHNKIKCDFSLSNAIVFIGCDFQFFAFRTFLSTRENMRDKKQLIEVQREMAWTEYVKNAMIHRASQ